MFLLLFPNIPVQLATSIRNRFLSRQIVTRRKFHPNSKNVLVPSLNHQALFQFLSGRSVSTRFSTTTPTKYSVLFIIYLLIIFAVFSRVSLISIKFQRVVVNCVPFPQSIIKCTPTPSVLPQQIVQEDDRSFADNFIANEISMCACVQSSRAPKPQFRKSVWQDLIFLISSHASL